MKVCGTCNEPVTYITTTSSGLYRHNATGRWQCSHPFTGDANTSQIEIDESPTKKEGKMSNPMKENAERIYSHTVTTELNGIDEILEFFKDVKRGGLQAILDVDEDSHHWFVTLLGTYPKLEVTVRVSEVLVELRQLEATNRCDDSEWITTASPDEVKKVGLKSVPLFTDGAVIYHDPVTGDPEVYCNQSHADSQLTDGPTWAPDDLQPITRDDLDELPDEVFNCVYCGMSVLV
jgi:hypothetical protein